MRITIGVTITDIFHQFCRRITQMIRHRIGRLRLHVFARPVKSLINRIALWGRSQIKDCLGYRQLTLRTAQALLCLPGIDRKAQSPWVCIANVFAGHTHHAARNIEWITTAIQHTHKPIQGRIRVRTTHRFMQG